MYLASVLHHKLMFSILFYRDEIVVVEDDDGSYCPG